LEALMAAREQAAEAHTQDTTDEPPPQKHTLSQSRQPAPSRTGLPAQTTDLATYGAPPE
ncbi:Hypothetical predicted protein, partial [Pelobates cultripes]